MTNKSIMKTMENLKENCERHYRPIEECECIFSKKGACELARFLYEIDDIPKHWDMESIGGMINGKE